MTRGRSSMVFLERGVHEVSRDWDLATGLSRHGMLKKVGAAGAIERETVGLLVALRNSRLRSSVGRLLLLLLLLRSKRAWSLTGLGAGAATRLGHLQRRKSVQTLLVKVVVLHGSGHGSSCGVMMLLPSWVDVGLRLSVIRAADGSKVLLNALHGLLLMESSHDALLHLNVLELLQDTNTLNEESRGRVPELS